MAKVSEAELNNLLEERFTALHGSVFRSDTLLQFMDVQYNFSEDANILEFYPWATHALRSHELLIAEDIFRQVCYENDVFFIRQFEVS